MRPLRSEPFVGQAFASHRAYKAVKPVQRNHETLYRSRKGRYYVEHDSQWQGSTPSAEWVSNHEATRWLLANDHELPKELAALEDEVSE